jgi:hypothetical protein
MKLTAFSIFAHGRQIFGLTLVIGLHVFSCEKITLSYQKETDYFALSWRELLAPGCGTLSFVVAQKPQALLSCLRESAGLVSEEQSLGRLRWRSPKRPRITTLQPGAKRLAGDPGTRGAALRALHHGSRSLDRCGKHGRKLSNCANRKDAPR